MSLTNGLAFLLILFCHERTSSPVATTMSNQPPTAPAAAPAPTSSSLRITEIHIGCPSEYNGKAETAQAWLDSVCLYLLINQALYHNNDRKIAYALSYMKKGSAAMWAEVRHQQGFANQSFGTFVAFETDFEKAFGNANIQQEAMNWLATTCITTGEQLQEYINQFKLNIIHAMYNEIKTPPPLSPISQPESRLGLCSESRLWTTSPPPLLGGMRKLPISISRGR